jgi:hypothetical protein
MQDAAERTLARFSNVFACFPLEAQACTLMLVPAGRVESNGVRNFRQALASPHPGLFHRVGAVRFQNLWRPASAGPQVRLKADTT